MQFSTSGVRYSKAQKLIKCSTCIKFFIHLGWKLFLLFFFTFQVSFTFLSHYGQQKVVKPSVSSRRVCFLFSCSLPMTSYAHWRKKACFYFNPNLYFWQSVLLWEWLLVTYKRMWQENSHFFFWSISKDFSHKALASQQRVVRRGEWRAWWLFQQILWHKEKRWIKLQQKLCSPWHHIRYLVLWSLNLRSVGLIFYLSPHIHNKEIGRHTVFLSVSHWYQNKAKFKIKSKNSLK